ncbi:MAG: Ig-like domain-containing protein [Actinomycetota bacterium]|nr:Ig-like domain-containing protein [Actinomycetota bacterium]
MLGAFGVVLIGLAAGGSSAQAAGCPSEQSVLPYSGNDPAYQCAQHASSGNKSIGSWDTKSWTNSTALGYTVKTHCHYRSDSNVTVTEAWAQSSYTATATNWAGSTRHFAAGVIFTTGPTDSGSYGSGCANSDGKMKNGIQRITNNVKITGGLEKQLVTLYQATITGTVSPSDATGYVVLMNGDNPIMVDASTPKTAPITNGTFTFKWTPLVPGTYDLSVAYPGDTSKCQAAAKSCGFTPSASSVTTMKIKKGSGDSNNPVPDSVSATAPGTESAVVSSTGTSLRGGPVGSAAATSRGHGPDARISGANDSGVVLKQKSARMPASLALNCSSGTVPLHAEVFGANTGRSLKYSKSGVSLKSGAVKKGRKASVQLLCREKNHSLKSTNRMGWGGAGKDNLKTAAKGGTLLGGPGADRLTVRHRRGVAHGGLGDDRITVAGKSGAATGGPGADVIRSKTTHRTLLIGGPGRDRIVTSGGRTRVDVRDGERDVVLCRGSSSHVRADKKDRLAGNCHRH